MTDAVAVCRRLFLDAPGIQDLAQDRIYGSEVPAEMIKQIVAEGGLPRKMVIISDGGGQEKKDSSMVIRPRLLIWSYGESFHEAGRMDLAVFECLDTLERRIVDRVLVHSALSGYPTAVRDAESKWPAQQRAVTLILSEEEVG